jgi:Flp pilus assembly protein CpaB
MALVTGMLVASAVEGAEAARAAWGDQQAVVVVRRDLLAGAQVGDGDVGVERRPAALVPSGALHELPAGATLRASAFAGEVLVEQRLAGAGLSPLAAALPAGTRAIAIPVEAGLAPPLQVGDEVDVLVALSPDAAGSGAPGLVLARRAPVVDVGEAAVTVAVTPEVAPKVGVALGSGAVTLALVGADDAR